MLSRLGPLASTARYGSWRLAERLSGYRPRTPAGVPASAEDITPRWLTAVMCGNNPGAAVDAIDVFGGSDGTTTRRELRVRYNAAGTIAGLPERLFCKATTTVRSRAMLGPIGRVESEVKFYREFRPELDIEALEAIFAGYHAPSGRSLILFRDIVALDGARFLDPDASVDKEKASSMVALIAAYQARFWGAAILRKNGPGLPTTQQYQQACNDTMPFRTYAEAGLDRLADALPSRLAARRDALWKAHQDSIRVSAATEVTLTHWDVHIGNWYVTPDGRMGLSDWSAKCGHWGADLAYALASALSVEDRRAWEEDLLRVYRESLAAAGAARLPSAEEVWTAYRRHMLHPLYFWAATIGAGQLQPDMQPDAFCVTNMTRMAQAIDDLDSMEANL